MRSRLAATGAALLFCAGGAGAHGVHETPVDAAHHHALHARDAEPDATALIERASTARTGDARTDTPRVAGESQPRPDVAADERPDPR